MLVDTHCHLDCDDFDRDLSDVLERARRSGVARMITVGCNRQSSERSVELSGMFEELYAAVGIHPHDARHADSTTLDALARLAEQNRKVVAIGEIGLDYYRDLSPRDVQRDVFRQCIRLAVRLKLPLIVHSRDAMEDTLSLLKDEIPGKVRGVMHCFSGDQGALRHCLELGLFISCTCAVTFSNASRLKEVARAIPVERLLLETDSPYMAPQEFRGKRNEPAYIVSLAQELARLHALTPEDIGRITTHNAQDLFGLEIASAPQVAYAIRDSLYLNITNRCTSNCSFCVRDYSNFVKGHNLKLSDEPSLETIARELSDLSRYKEVVFCGFGEPTLRLDIVKAVSRELKKRGTRTRLVTNGHGDLINGRSIAPELKGLIDRVSISLNADSQAVYDRIARPSFGASSYTAVLDFIRSCVREGFETEVTCLNLDGVDTKQCEELARGLGASFRLRKLGIVG